LELPGGSLLLRRVFGLGTSDELSSSSPYSLSP